MWKSLSSIKNSAALVALLLLLFNQLAWPARESVAVGGLSDEASLEVEKRSALNTLEEVPLQFLENRGQLDAEVKFYLQGRDKSVYFTQQGITISLTEAAPDTTKPFNLGGPLPQSQARRGWTLKLDFVNANPSARLRAQNLTGVRTNYLKGKRHRWLTELPAYGAVIYEDLWPGIDLIYSGTNNSLKYEFVVKPETDPNQIRLAYRGASSIQINREGRLDVATPLGRFQDKAPYSYQKIDGRQIPVPSAFKLDSLESNYGFRVGSYDPTKPLIIDPALLIYAGYLGGTADERAFGIAVDDSGNAYLTGTTSSSEVTFPVTAGADSSFAGVQDAFVIKINQTGRNIVYATYIGGTGDDVGFDIAVDKVGNAYLTGATSSGEGSFPVTIGPDLHYNGGAYDAFVAKLNASGNALAYCGYIGGAGADGGSAIAVDVNGNAFIAGGTNSTEVTFPTKVGPDLTYNGGQLFGDAFVAQVNTAGTALTFCGYLGGAGDDLGLAIAIDVSGNVFIAGGTTSSETTFPIVSGPDLTFNGGLRDAFVAKLQAGGASLVYSGYLGGSAGETAFGLSLDAAGNVYIAGETTSSETTFPVKVGPDLSYNGGSDAFVAKVDSTGAGIIYCGYIGGADRDMATDVRVDGKGSAHVTGSTTSKAITFPISVGPSLTFSGGSFNGDAFVAKVNHNGAKLDRCGYVGGSAEEIAYALALDSDGNDYLAGETSSTADTFPVLVGPDLTLNGGVDVFVAKVSASITTPNCSAAEPSLQTIWPPNHRKVSISVTGVTAADGSAVSVTIDRIMQDEPTDGPEGGKTCDALIPQNSASAFVRAERSGDRNGRVYTIYFTATEGRTGVCHGSVKVSVPLSQNGTPAIDDGPNYDSAACSFP